MRKPSWAAALNIAGEQVEENNAIQAPRHLTGNASML